MVRLRLLLVALLVTACATVQKAPPPLRPGDQISGLASWYGQEYAGRTTANGEIFDPMLLTAAHRTLPFGTILKVLNPATGKAVEVRVNDRGPFVGERVIDLSYAAAEQLGLVDAGVSQVDMTVLKIGAGDREPPVPYIVSIPGSSEAPAPDAAPAVPFPIPETGTAAPTSAKPSTPPAEDVFDVNVVEERAGQITRKEVTPEGTSVRSVPVGPAAPPSAAPPASAVRPAAPPPPSPRAPARSGFVIQLGAFQSRTNAESLRDRAAAIFPQSYLEAAGEVYRVRVGPFATKAAAIDAREKLEAGGFSGMVIGADQ